VKKIDKHRANYYRYYTDQQWGAASNYDLVVNTTYADISGAVAVIKAMLIAGEMEA
jgi:cytidylate kinase